MQSNIEIRNKYNSIIEDLERDYQISVLLPKRGAVQQRLNVARS